MTLANYRAGLIATILYNTNKRKTAKAMEPLDWFGGKDRKIQTAEEVRARMTAWAAVVSRKN